MCFRLGEKLLNMRKKISPLKWFIHQFSSTALESWVKDISKRITLTLSPELYSPPVLARTRTFDDNGERWQRVPTKRREALLFQLKQVRREMVPRSVSLAYRNVRDYQESENYYSYCILCKHMVRDKVPNRSRAWSSLSWRKCNQSNLNHRYYSYQ